MSKFYIGVDIGGTEVKTALVDENDKAVFAQNIPTESEKGYVHTINMIANQIKALLDDNKVSLSMVNSIGIGIPGLTDGKSKVYMAPNISWVDIDIKAEMDRHFPRTSVFIANDASVAALAEHHFGAIKGAKNAVMITLGTGVGGGVIINDKLYSGTNGIASEIGHLIVGENFYNCNCGNNGCLETYCSATAIIKYAQRLFVDSPCSKIIEMTDSKPENITAKLIFDAYKEKDLMAKIIVKRFVTYLSIGIINLMNVYDPEVFVIGGGVSKAYDLFIDELEKEVDERLTFKNAPRGKIVKAKLGNDAGAIGAAMLGLYM